MMNKEIAATKYNEFIEKKRIVYFAAACLAIIAANALLIKQWIVFSLNNNFASHVILIPFISTALIFRDRKRIFSGAQYSFILGASVSILASVMLIFPWITGALQLSLQIAAFVLLLLGVFLFFFGVKDFRNALFPLLFLFLMIPFPEELLQPIVAILQKGSAEMSAILFKVTGTSYFREGTFFALPSVNINIAPQCSGIRSSLALFITCLLAGHLMLETGWRKVLFVLVCIPVAMFKNAVRIVGLTLLAIYVSPGWLTNSRLHSEGGALFFMLGLAVMAPLLLLLRKSEVKKSTQ
jgi:exosortase